MATATLAEAEETMSSHSAAPFTRADLEGMPDDGRRYEIIDGVLIVSAAPSRLHQRASRRLTILLDAACPSDLEVFAAPFAVVLADDTEMQPDLLVGWREDFTERNLPVAPLLAVEILSPSSRIIDSRLKRARLERAGTRSYWTVDPAARLEEARLIAWELGADGRYKEVAQVSGNESFTTDLPFPISVVPADLVR